jgi:sugar lactone lactonase YvrE
MMTEVTSPQRFTAEPLFSPASEALRFLPECPRVLQHRPGHLAWIAIQHAADSTVGNVNVLNLTTLENREYPLPARPGFFVETTTPGLLLVGMERRLVLLDLNTGALRETGVTVTTDERVIINDGLAVPGGVIFGTKHLTFSETIAKLYYFAAGTFTVKELAGGQICSNGKFYRPQERKLVDIDSSPKTITEYEFKADWSVAQSRLITPPAKLPAIPDGLRPSPDGQSVVVAYYNPDSSAAGLAQQIALADGAVLTEWVLPGSPRVTCPELFLRDGRVCVLFTTAVEGMPDAERVGAPRAGDFFWADTPFTTLPAPPPLLDLP